MGESLTQRYYVGDDGNCCKSLSLSRIMTLLKKEAPANSVPAAAARQEGRVLFFIIRRKGSVGNLISWNIKFLA